MLEDADQIIGYAWIAGDRPDRTDCWLCDGLDIGCAGITKGNPELIDAPGLIPTHRSAKNYQAVLASALTKLEPGFKVSLNSWGDSDGTIMAYLELGFVEHKRTAIMGRTI